MNCATWVRVVRGKNDCGFVWIGGVTIHQNTIYIDLPPDLFSNTPLISNPIYHQYLKDSLQHPLFLYSSRFIELSIKLVKVFCYPKQSILGLLNLFGLNWTLYNMDSSKYYPYLPYSRILRLEMNVIYYLWLGRLFLSMDHYL